MSQTQPASILRWSGIFVLLAGCVLCLYLCSWPPFAPPAPSVGTPHPGEPPCRDHELVVRTDFSGGSVDVARIDQRSRTVVVSPREHPNGGWAVWWYFRLDGVCPGEETSLEVARGSLVAPTMATYSMDAESWLHTPKGESDGDVTTYRVRIQGRTAWFAWGPPFALEDAVSLAARASASSPDIQTHMLTTRAGRSSPKIVFSPNGSGPPSRGVWIQARQHAWESGSSFVAAGFVEWLLANGPRARSLREVALITVILVMDGDSVEIGAGGKDQKPRDHNRDWDARPYWPEVAAAQEDIRQQDRSGRIDLFIDLHNPGPDDIEPFFFAPPLELTSKMAAANIRDFIGIAKVEMVGPLAFLGLVRRADPSYVPDWQRIASNWVAANSRSHVVSLGLEVAWNTPHSTAESYLQLGRELALATERYLRQPGVTLRREEALGLEPERETSRPIRRPAAGG